MRNFVLAGLAGLLLTGPVLADDRRGWQDDRRDRGGWDRGDRGRDGYRGDGYRGNWDRGNRNDWRWDRPRYRGPAFIHPRGYGYRPWGVGYRLPPAYFTGRNFIGNPGYYRLPPPYYGTRWIRVGPDALLIRIGDGIILQAVRGLYW